MAPEMIRKANIPNMAKGIIVHPSSPTCQGQDYDYFPISETQRAAVVGCQRLEDAGLHPHWPARLILRGDARRMAVRKLRRPKGVPGQIPQGPLPEQLNYPTPEPRQAGTCSRHGRGQEDGNIELLSEACETWMSHARAEWASLLSDEPDLRPVTTRWEPTLGCHTKAEVDAPRIACQWRRLASSAEEVMDCWSSPKRAERHTWATARRHVGRIVHLAGTMKHEPECKADPIHWCNNVLRSLSSGNLDIVKRLITVARHVGNEQDKTYRAADAKAWELWLRGEQPKGGTTVHKRAFRFLKGQVGWVRSPLSAQEHFARGAR